MVSNKDNIIAITNTFVSYSAPNWTLYFFWRNDAYNNAVTLVAFANLSECTLMLFMFAISRLFGTISRRILGERLAFMFLFILLWNTLCLTMGHT